MKGSGSHTEYVVSENDVACVFRSVNVTKCGGPDGLKGWIFKHCALQLSSNYAFMFNWSIREYLVPPKWKTSELTPVPKKSAAKELNDLKPIALTSIVTKCLEKLLVRKIKKCFSVLQDPIYTNISIRLKAIVGYYLSISPQLLTPFIHTF